MPRLIFDGACVVTALVMVLRLRGRVAPRVVWGAALSLVLSVASYSLMVSAGIKFNRIFLDILWGSVLVSSVVWTRGRWERLAERKDRFDSATATQTDERAVFLRNAVGVSAVALYFVITFLFTGQF